MNEFTREMNAEHADDEPRDDTQDYFCPNCLLNEPECICNAPTPDETFIRYAELGTDELPF